FPKELLRRERPHHVPGCARWQVEPWKARCSSPISSKAGALGLFFLALRHEAVLRCALERLAGRSDGLGRAGFAFGLSKESSWRSSRELAGVFSDRLARARSARLRRCRTGCKRR